MFFVDYDNGTEKLSAATLSEAKTLADKGATNTGKNITIQDESGAVVATRKWNPYAYDDECPYEEKPIEIGSGYYSDWK